MKVRIKKLKEEAVIPSYSYNQDACFDLTAISMNTVQKLDHGYLEYGTGLVIEIPDDHVGLIFPRSSISKQGLILSNSVGVIDPGYLGEIKFRFKYISGTSYYQVGDRIGQMMIIPRPKVEFELIEDMNESERGDGGFGSTGN